MSERRSTGGDPRRLVAKARRRSAQVAFRTALGPISGAVLRRYVFSIAEHVGSHPVKGHIDDMRVLRSAYIERYPFDSSLPPQFRRVKAFDDRYVYHLRDVCVSPRTGLCWLPKGPILGESIGSFIRLLGWDDDALEEPLLRPRQRISGSVIVLPTHGYYHWLLECLPPALHALAAVPDATVVVPSDPPQYVREAIDLLGMQRVRYADEPVFAEKLVLVAHEPFSGFVPGEDIEILRATLQPRSSNARAASSGIYVSRRLSRRSLRNEPELERALQELGMSIVYPQRLPFPDQIATMRHAEIVVAPHGAGLANLVFAPRLRSTLELFMGNLFNDCYARLTVSCGGAYLPISCPGATGAAVSDAVAPVSDIVALLNRQFLHRSAADTQV